MAYRCDNGTLWIYDPNYSSDDTLTLTISGLVADFDYYEDYAWFYFVGNGSLYVNEPYSRILEDAEENFNGSHNAQITVTSHTYGQWVGDEAYVFEGNVESGDVLVDRMEILLNGNLLKTDVNSEGRFQFGVYFQPGDNFIEFNPRGQLEYRGSVPVSHNMVRPFKVVGDQEPLPGQLRFDVFIEPRYSVFRETTAYKPFLAVPGVSGTAWINYYVRGSLDEEPFALWEDLTNYDGLGEALVGKIRLTATNLDAGKYEVGMSAPVLSNCPVRVTSITASGVASGSWDVENGSPNVDQTWRGVVYDTATGEFTLIDSV
jgi:hypothetical protein